MTEREKEYQRQYYQTKKELKHQQYEINKESIAKERKLYYADNKELPEYMSRLMYNPYLGVIFFNLPVENPKGSGKLDFYFVITPIQTEKLNRPYYFCLTGEQTAEIIRKFDNFDKGIKETPLQGDEPKAKSDDLDL